MNKKAYLILADGTVFEGKRFGATHEAMGELVFTTGMGGYIETLTDPSFAGQIVIQTFPMIGNYGMITQDYEGIPRVKGYVVREYCEVPSNFRSENDIDSWLKEQGIPGICGVDTRELTRIIRSQGVINALISDHVPANLDELKNFKVENVLKEASCANPEFHPAQGEKRFHVALLDYGAKRNIIRCLQQRGCDVTVLPYDTSASEILALGIDGVMLSNGPGDPAENTYSIRQIQEIVGKIPVFGICLGHQLMALAMGGKTYKMKFGHRGVNQPVKDMTTGKTYVTTQNHGYAVDQESLKGIGTLRFANVNDGTCEGMSYPGKKAMTVQFHPEACAGPHDTMFLFDEFMKMMEEEM